jgi:hypothetical protein
VRRQRVGNVLVRAFARPGVPRLGATLRIARRTVEALERRLAPYGSRELDMVLLYGGAGGFAGMEYPELVFTVPFPVVIAHEIAHQWWYGLVGNDQYREPWLDESFASYFDHRLHPIWNSCEPDRPYALVAPGRRHVPLNSSMARFEGGSPFAIAEVVYEAGACALQRLERDIGRARMTAFLRLLQTRFRYGVMRTADVLDAIRDVAPGYDLARWVRVAHLSADVP